MNARQCVCAVFALAATVCLSTIQVASARSDAIDLRIHAEHVGLLGQVRAGTWMPLLIELENQSDRPRVVRCQWQVPDGDGDRVIAQRKITLGAGRVAQAWLYAMAPLTISAQDTWHVRVIDQEQNRTVATQMIRPVGLLQRQVGVIGIMGSGGLGLEPYTSSVTQHERCRLLRMVEPSQLPDRWYGLSLMQALVWTPEGGDPGSPLVSSDTRRAIRQWVQRGGHLVVVLESVGDPWFGSPLSSMLPPVAVGQVAAVDPPAWLGKPVGPASGAINMRVVEPSGKNAQKVSVLLTDQAQRPVVVAWPYGFGRVTLVGVNLSEPALVRAGLPQGPQMWSAIFGWRSPAYPQKTVDQEIQQGHWTGATFRRRVDLDRFIPRLIGMRNTATPALLAAMTVFGLYWLLAGPISFAILKKRQQLRHSWSVFVVVVLIFSVCTWTGAWALRSGDRAIAHFSVLDAVAESGLRCVHSWLSLVVSKHGPVELAITPNGVDVTGNTLASPGTGTTSSGFFDPQSYQIQAVSPDHAKIPFRATAKQLQLSYLGRLEDQGTDWGLPSGPIKLVDGKPRGTLVHRLPGELENVLVVYCPGDGRTPLVWRRRKPWLPGQPMILQQPDHAEPLVGPHQGASNQTPTQQGYLGRLIAFKTGQSWPTQDDSQTTIAGNEIVQAIEMLSFYSMLPPPDYRNTNPMSHAANYERHFGRPLDLTALTALRCVILIGHMAHGPLPMPLTADGQSVSADGWTVVRWIDWLDEQ